MMRMQLRQDVPPEVLRRKARVLAYRLAHGELVVVAPTDPVWEVEWSMRVPHGAAEGSYP